MTHRSGQTLVEVMVALFVLVTGFLGILSLLAQSIAISKTTSDETIATYLAEEGIELARNIVDHDMYQRLAKIGAPGWAYDEQDPTFGSGGTYYLDYTTCNSLSSKVASCDPFKGADPGFLNFDPETDLYSYGGNGVATPFDRQIKVTTFSDLNELKVDSIVTWSTGSFTQQSVDLEDVFYNWHP